MKKLGLNTLKLDNPANILNTASIVGPKESNGPLAEYFDTCVNDEFWGEKTWEEAESKFIITKFTFNFLFVYFIFYSYFLLALFLHFLTLL